QARRRRQARRRWPAIPQRARRIHEDLADPDDRGVGLAEALARAVDDGPLALRDRLVLHADAGDAEEFARLVRVPVAPVIVPRVRGGAVVGVGLGGGGGVGLGVE